MAVISELAVAISARTEKLQAGLRRAANEVKIFGVGINAIASGLAGGLATGAAAAAASLAYMTKQQIAAIDSAVELGERVGASQRDIAGFGLAANVVGGSAEQIAGGLAKMNRTIGDAAGGSKKAAKAIESLGLSVSDLIAMKPTEAFGRVADAIKSIESPAGQASAAVSIFGKSGAELLNVLQLGSAGLADFRKRADETGLSVNQMAAEDVSAAADSIDILKANVVGLANSFTSFLAPSITAATDVLNSFFIRAESGEEANRQIVELTQHYRDLAKIREGAVMPTTDPAAPGETPTAGKDQQNQIDRLIQSLDHKARAMAGDTQATFDYEDAVANHATPAELERIQYLHESIKLNEEYEERQKNLADAAEEAAQREIDWTHKKIDAINEESRARFEAGMEIAELEAAAAERRRANESIRELAPAAIRGSAEAYRLITARETRGAESPMTKLQKETNEILKRLERKFGPVIAEF